MCGIVAYKGQNNANSVVIEALKRLEYRGYDSWGIAWPKDGKIRIIKKTGKIGEAVNLPETGSNLAIAHTRWATHGSVEEKNAHPLLSNNRNLAVVHNGIIENSAHLREFLLSRGFRFDSDTDSEVIPNLIEFYLSQNKNFREAFSDTLSRLEGAYAIVAFDNTEKMFAFARRGSPLCIGLNDNEIFVASDVSAFLDHTRKVIYLEDGEYGFIDEKGLTLKRIGLNKSITRKPTMLNWSQEMAEKNGFPHFMLKEIFEQPKVIEETLAGRISDGKIILDDLKISDDYLKNLKRLRIIACGTANHAGLISKYIIEELVGIDVETDYAGEFKYRNSHIDKNDLYIFISQSGETAETLDAMRKTKAAGAKTLSIVNAMGSTLARESDFVLYTRAGLEIGVASTKAFTSQQITMLLFAIYLAQLQGKSNAKIKNLLKELSNLSKKVEILLKNTEGIKSCAKQCKNSESMFYIGRNINYPIALEGALKLKEVSYVHAEGLPAGELKHGPLAMIDEKFITVCIAPDSSTYDKMLNSIQEIKARNGKIMAIATEGNQEIKKLSDYTLFIPKIDELLSAILTVIPLQLLAYYTALERGCDVDKPRNLAKSVTVE